MEVKGTTGAAREVLPTPNEVAHAIEYPRVALFVLSNISVVRNDHGEVTASGGVPTVLLPWAMEKSRLLPIGYK